MTLLKRDDVFTVMTAELEKRYSAFVQVYMPPRLDSATDPSVSGTVLTPDQSNVLLLAERGYNIYIGGSAGTGKTVLLKSIYRKLSQEGLRVAVTATTGVAAVQLGGCTFHYAFNAPVVLDMSRPQRWDATALRAVDVVIIDEVSLLNASRLDAFDMEARLARMSRAPFGGIQVILCGDFLQLSIEGPDQLDTQPLFQSQAFKNFVQLRLVTPMRHAAGDPLLELLTKLRRGIFDQRMFDQLNRPIPADTTHITYIFPRRREAKQLNERKLEELQSTEHVYIPQRGPLELVGTFTPSAFIDMPLEATSLPSRELVVQLLREEILEVCPEAVAVNELDCVIMPARTAHVSMLMRVRHPDKQLLHRMTPSGPILGASALKPGQWEQVAENVAKKVGGRLVRMYDKEPPNLIPLSVSMTLADMNSSDTSDVLAPLRLKLGCRVMINRNLSRTVSNGSVGVVEAFSEPDPTLFPTGIGSYSFHQLKEKTLFSTLPVVRLLSGEVVQVPPISVASGGTPLTYYYKHDVYPLPLQLGYSFTVHKVQGLTLQGTVVMDCANFFDCPHLLYVACSRVRSLDQLIVYNVEARMISVRRSALQFADGLAEAHNPAILIPPADMPRASWTERTAQRVLKLEE
ncbi:AAA domain/PIF1-like helicase, putative [Angomonas deanei]|uniref:ATP-dependent DNA helicase n=1 Tax=Angomonas deanei TaxID=59799 RepID=A0A7G2CIH0_9TRYP|nr:AAA domain/PIF1-like helicase, putative [Angomonas deanei]